YDAWADAGNQGWSFADLLQDFVTLETDVDFGSADYHGTGGPIPISRCKGSHQSELAAAGTDALVAAGLKPIEDHNAPGAVGVGPLPLNLSKGRRINSWNAYIDPILDRNNFTVMPNCEVVRINFSGTSVRGVTLADGNVISAGEVILCT